MLSHPPNSCPSPGLRAMLQGGLTSWSFPHVWHFLPFLAKGSLPNLHFWQMTTPGSSHSAAEGSVFASDHGGGEEDRGLCSSDPPDVRLVLSLPSRKEGVVSKQFTRKADGVGRNLGAELQVLGHWDS